MPAPIAFHLSLEDKRRLWKLRLRTPSRRVWMRTSALLMLSNGEQAGKVAETFGVSRDAITDWKRRWLKGRFFQLADRPHTGRPPLATPRYLRILREAVERGPSGCGYLFTVWSAARLAEHMKRKTRIDLVPKQIRHWLRKLGFVFRRPKHTLRSRQDPKAVQAGKTRLKALKKGLSSLLRDSSFGSRMKQTSICILI